MSDRYPHVFSPIKLGPVEIKNRFYFSPHGSPYVVGSGPSDNFAYYYGARAAGGCGLCIHALSVMPGRGGLGVTPYLEESIPSFRAAAKVVHDNGGKIFGDVHYSWVNNEWMYEPGSPRAPTFAPSPIQMHDDFFVTHEMSVATINKVVEAHKISARNLGRAGYDGFALSCTHGMLVEAFLSPYFNRRTDEYGGSLENRMRFVVECLQAAREGAGPNLAVGMRYNANEMVPSGLTTDDTRDILARLVARQLLDYVEIEVGLEPNQLPISIPTYLHPKDLYKSAVAAIRHAAGDVPVLSVIGRITTVAEAEELIDGGVVDMVGSIRGLMAEPNLVRHAAEGREDESRTCLACNLCMRINAAHHALGCAINPETGREKSWTTFTPAARPSNVVVVGAGPAGLEAARVAAEKGHRVLVLEKTRQLGGQLRLWSQLPDREIFSTTTEWYERQLERLGVEVRFGVEATPETVLAARPDAVIIATGSRYIRTGQSGFMNHAIPGWDQDWVLTPEQIIEEGRRPKGKVLILDEEGMNTSAGVAEILASDGADVTIITRAMQPLRAMLNTFEFAIEIPRLKNLGVAFETMTYIRELGDHAVTIFDVFTDAETTIPDVAAVVMATTRRADPRLAQLLVGKVHQLFSAGDALAPRGLTEAIHEGYRFARIIGETNAPKDFNELYFSPINYDMFQKPASVLDREQS